MSKKCTPLWREARFQVKMYKAPHPRSTFRNWDVEKVHTVVARSTFPSQNVQDTSCSDHFWKLRCRKSARRCGVKHISKSKCTKHHMYAPLLDVEVSFCVAGARDCPPCQEWAKRKGFVTFPKTMAGVGHLKRICKDAFSVAGAVQETCSSEMLGGPGADFLRGVTFWSMRSSVLGRWFCVTGAALRITFSWQAQYFRQVEWKNHKTHWHEAVSSALNFPFLKEISQNCLVFDVVNFENWGSLAGLFRFWFCQVKKMRKSRRMVSFLTLSSSKNEEVSQSSCVFKLAGRETDR